MQSERQRLLHHTLATIALIAWQTHRCQAVAAGEHAHLFLQLCDLVNLAQRPASTKLSEAAGRTSYLSIVKLNNSIGTQAWQQVIKAYNEPPSSAQTATPVGKAAENPNPREPYWKAAAKEVPNEVERKKVLAAAGLQEAADTRLAAYRKIQRPIAEQAFITMNDIVSIANGQAKDAATQAARALKKAAYGRTDFSPNAATATDAKGEGGDAASRQDLCGRPNTGAKANTIAQVILCLCAYDTDSRAFCESTQTAANLNLAGTPNTHLTNLLSLCPASTDTEAPTVSEINTKLAKVLAQVKSKATDVYLGHFSGTGCDGTAANGVCIMYTANNKAAQDKFNKIQWISELQKAAKLQRQHELAQAELKGLTAQLAADRKLAYSLLPAVVAELDDQSEATRVENKATNTGKKEAQSKCSDGKNKSAEECQTLGCDHDTENNKCKPKPGSETKAAGAGETSKDGEAAAGFATHKYKSACGVEKNRR
uniref:Variant surface glycoprotein 1091 n=1 Tax=Trypanosoma brucei TaxID=5691 RepID=M4SXL6_9TRYP|nr:variant surface glycoprotein 1091 [Trypanosoma brucei]